MRQAIIHKKAERKNELWDWILIIGVTLSPMNYLRIWKVGPGELFCLVWGVRYLFHILNQPVYSILTRFWLLFLPVICLGTAFGVWFYPKETSISGLFTYVYFLIVSEGVYVGMRQKRPDQIRTILNTIAIVVSCWYMFLYLYSLNVSRFFLGIRLWFGGVRFAGGGNNPHLMATLIAVALFCNIIVVFQKDETRSKKLISAICAVFCLIISGASRSSTSAVTIVLTGMAFLVYQLLVAFRGKRERWIAFSLLVIVVTLVVGLFWNRIIEYIYNWISEDANGIGRLSIFKSIVYTLQKNWIVGLGPGTHGANGKIEYHNMYLEILAMGGLLGFGIFAAFVVRLFNALRVRPVLCFVLLPLFTYGIAGFSMRRLCFWVVVPILIAFSDTLRSSERKSFQEFKIHSAQPDKLMS